MQIPGYIPPLRNVSELLDFSDINFNESRLAIQIQKILPSIYMKLKAPEYLCKSDPFILRNT